MKTKVKILYQFEARTEKELSINVGDIVSIEYKLSSGWWLGKNADGKVGLFPSNYGEVVEQGDEDVVYEDVPKEIKLDTNHVSIDH